MQKQPSLLEGLELPDKLKGGGKTTRRDGFTASARRAVSHDWTPTQKKIAAIGLAAGAVVALIYGGISVYHHIPPQLPKTFDEGTKVMASANFKNLDQVRQEQYLAEMGRLVQGKMTSMSDEDRRKFFRDPANREILDQIREQQFDEAAKKVARGEKLEMPFGPGGFRGMRGPEGAPGANAVVSTTGLRPGDDPPSPPPRIGDERRSDQQRDPNNPGNRNNQPGGQGAPGTPTPGAPTPGSQSPAPGGSAPAPSGGGGGSAGGGGGGNPGGGGAGGGGGGRRGNPVSRIASRIQNGNAQSNGLRHEMMQKMGGPGGPGGMGGPGGRGRPNGQGPNAGQNPAVRVLFTSGSAELNEGAYLTIASIVKQLTDQPETALRIWGLVDQATDGPKMRRMALRDSFAVNLFGSGAKGEQLTKAQLEQQMTIAYNELRAKQAKDAGKPAPALVGPNSEVPAPPLAEMEDALVKDTPVPIDRLVLLAQQREDAIAKYLVEQKQINKARVHTVAVVPRFMETEKPSSILQVGR